MSKVGNPAHGDLGPAASGFGLAAIVTIMFSTALTCLQDAFPQVAHVLAVLGGHHWTGHGLLNVALYLCLGGVLTHRGMRLDGTSMAWTMTLTAVFGGSVLILWFLLV